MDKSLLMFQQGGIRCVQKVLGDSEQTLYFKARNPSQIAAYYSAERRFPDTEAGDIGRDKMRAEFIAGSLCDESGAPLLTAEEAQMIPIPLRVELCLMITSESNRPGDPGKSSFTQSNGSGTS